MKPFFKIVLAVLILTPLLVWGGFHIWLSNQPEDFQAQVYQFTPLEFVGVIRESFFPGPVIDRAAYGRRDYPDRGHSPWVVRSSLDGRPRMLSIALAPELWLTYSTETAGIHQLWRGGIDFTGPVYDGRHGREPTSHGSAYLSGPLETTWRTEGDAGWEPAKIQWLGHGFDPETGALWLRYEIRTARNESRVVTEWPEHVQVALASAASLSRRFEFSTGPPVALEVKNPPEALGGATYHDRRLHFAANLRKATTVFRYETPEIDLRRTIASESEADPFGRHDCHTCHNERERVVGPAWSEIALRHAGANRAVTIDQLARRIREGSRGLWGDAMMTPHPGLDLATARKLAGVILDTPPSETPVVAVDTGGAEATWTFRSDTAAPPKTLHPSLSTTRLDTPEFTPLVGGLAWLPDGRLAVSTWDPDGAVFAIDGRDAEGGRVQIDRIAEGLHEPLGLEVVGERLFVMQKQELTELVDANGDDWIDEYRTVANDWTATSNFHEFSFGLVTHDDHFYASLGACVLNGGKSCREQTRDRGHVIRIPVPPEDPGGDAARARPQRSHRYAGGFRTPNGLAISPSGDLFVTDNQGDWLPASKLIRVREGAQYGWQSPSDLVRDAPASPPALWLPQNEIGNSPTEPLFLTQGPYRDQVLFGDIYNGGLKRAVLEKVDGILQGAAFHFSGGFNGPINRILGGPDGSFVVGQVGSHGNWGEPGKNRFGLEFVRMGDSPAFEPMNVSILPGGFRIELSHALADEIALETTDVIARDWFYVPSAIYGGPKYDLRELPISAIELSPDRQGITLAIDGLETGRVVYLRLDERLRSRENESLWVNETWYTINALPEAPHPTAHASVRAAPADRPNQLTEAECLNGWELLFDGKSFSGWKIYGREDDTIEHWTIDDDALHFTRDVSLAGLIWNHVNPFTPAAIDLMTRERFEDFELLIDWRVTPGGNSGIFYAIPDESTSLSWDLALEMQVLDDAEHPDGQKPRRRAGDLYDLQSLATGAAREAGEWNTARLRVEGDRVQHWLNDVQTVDMTRGSAQWDEALAESKFAGKADFGRARRGHISLQDHGDPVWFRNIKIRRLPFVASERSISAKDCVTNPLAP